VRPYVPRNKTDRTDAKGLLEAARNADLHAVPVKSIDQQCLAALHRLRSTWIATRTSRINTVRGILRELGHSVPVGPQHLVSTLGRLLREPDSDLPDVLRQSLSEALKEIGDLEAKTKEVERELNRLAAGDTTVQRLRSVPGIGLLTATALVAFVGDVRRFRSGRHFASYLGLTPREMSSGSIRRLGSISKRGDTYVRMLLTHGARSTLWHSKRVEHPDRLRAWALKIQETRGHNKATCALANKLARIAWAVWRSDVNYVATTT
jgi:transposase